MRRISESLQKGRNRFEKGQGTGANGTWSAALFMGSNMRFLRKARICEQAESGIVRCVPLQ